MKTGLRSATMALLFTTTACTANPPKGAGHFAEGDAVLRNRVGRVRRVQPGEDGQLAEKAFDDVVDVDEFDLVVRVGDGDGQVVCDVVAEGGGDGVVVGSAPFAEEVW